MIRKKTEKHKPERLHFNKGVSTKEGNLCGKQDFAHDVDVIVNVDSGLSFGQVKYEVLKRSK